MNATPFADLGLEPNLLRALTKAQYERPTPIQVAAIPDALAGRDLLGIAQTGTGKTAAFGLPLLQRLGRSGSRERPIRALILTPTRELALQVNESLVQYGCYLQLRSTVVLGGVSAVPQIKALAQKPDILVATPGRLLDLVSQGHVDLGKVEVLVLDEADRMLDMGFIQDVRRIVAKVPRQRQTLFFSATMPPEVTELAASMLRDPVRVEVTPNSSVGAKVVQHVLFVERTDKAALLLFLVNRKKARRVLVFARTKHRANRIAKQLVGAKVNAAAIHSNKTQGARQRALADFAAGATPVLVATDIVARGIDVDNISHVINFDLPDEAENYVHRIGRTARAGSGGFALSFCDADEGPKLRDIERLVGQELSVDVDHPFHSESLASQYRSRVFSKATAKPGVNKTGVKREPRPRQDRPERAERTGPRPPRGPRVAKPKASPPPGAARPRAATPQGSVESPSGAVAGRRRRARGGRRRTGGRGGKRA
ncbi:MAG: DEAD/DEAH box helicase [Planctomycetota bacterium]